MIRRSKYRKRLPELTSSRGKYFVVCLVYLLSASSDLNVTIDAPESGASMKSTMLTWVALIFYAKFSTVQQHDGERCRSAYPLTGLNVIGRGRHAQCSAQQVPGLQVVHVGSVHVVELPDHRAAQRLSGRTPFVLTPVQHPRHPLELVKERRAWIVVEVRVLGEEVSDWVGLSLSL